MNLNDLFEQDIDDVFMDGSELMQSLIVDGKLTDGILILESQFSVSNKRNLGGISKIDGTALFLKFNEEIYKKYKPKRAIEVEDVTYIITNRSREFGLIKLKLEEREGY